MTLGTGIVLLVLVAIVGLIIRGLVKDKHAGKTTCGGDCSHCGGPCHYAEKPKQ